MNMATEPAVALGIDLGTSGVRAATLSVHGELVDIASSPFAGPGSNRSPSAWWAGVRTCLEELASRGSLAAISCLSVDGTSGTVLALDADGAPIGDALMYNDTCADPTIVERIAAIAPANSPARGATSPLARAIHLSRLAGVRKIVHQADWIALQLGLPKALSDENNALKTGYDLAKESWPDWLDACGMNSRLLPDVRRAGAPLASIGPMAQGLGLPPSCMIHAGTTDGCASFLATGAAGIGDGVTALGSTLVLKLACAAPIDAADYGIYSHRVMDFWLAGGASNTGGGVLKTLFSDEQVKALTPQLQPEQPAGLDYYPLSKPGERFPINDPAYPPRLTPRPADDRTYFQAVLEGMTSVERLGYDRLAELGGPALRSVRTVGGGAANPGWTRMREKALGVSMPSARSTEAAVGAATLALAGKARWS